MQSLSIRIIIGKPPQPSYGVPFRLDIRCQTLNILFSPRCSFTYVGRASKAILSLLLPTFPAIHPH